MNPKTYRGSTTRRTPRTEPSKGVLLTLAVIAAFALGVAWPDTPPPDALACSDGIAAAADPSAAAAACMNP